MHQSSGGDRTGMVNLSKMCTSAQLTHTPIPHANTTSSNQTTYYGVCVCVYGSVRVLNGICR